MAAIDIALTTFLGIVIVLATTRAFTECRYWLLSRGNARRFEGQEPLTLPYTIPWLGGFSRMMSPHACYQYALSMSPQKRPVKLRVGPIGIYLLFGEKNVKMIFKNSKVLTKYNSTLVIFKNSGMPQQDLDIFAKDTSGWYNTPSIDIQDKDRVWKKTHDITTTHLSGGASVTLLTDKFVENFIVELDKEPLGHTSVMPLHELLKKTMFTASMLALVGPEILKLTPNLVETYWQYDEAFLMIAIGLPKLVYPKGEVKTKMIAAVTKWIKEGWKNLDEKDLDSPWEKNFGSKYIRETAAVLRDAGMSAEGQAASILTIIWAINSNAIPCTVWTIFETLQRPGLIERVREEVSASVITTSSGEMSLDIPKLVKESPLLTSIYLESLRTRASNTITRTLTDDLECDGYILKKGNWIMSPSWIPSYGPLWDVPGHPATEFWPERFIEMPKMRPSDPEEKAQFDTAMKPDNFFPYGGGNIICSGRFFAKQEIMTAVALLVLKFDIQPHGWIDSKGKTSDRPARPDEAYAGSGVLPPDRDLMVKITRKR